MTVYVGCSGRNREVFKSNNTPTRLTTPHYLAVIGPFKTIRGAKYMANYGLGNPHLQCVADAERLSKYELDI